jgi:hypothetical protein
MGLAQPRPGHDLSIHAAHAQRTAVLTCAERGGGQGSVRRDGALGVTRHPLPHSPGDAWPRAPSAMTICRHLSKSFVTLCVVFAAAPLSARRPRARLAAVHHGRRAPGWVQHGHRNCWSFSCVHRSGTLPGQGPGSFHQPTPPAYQSMETFMYSRWRRTPRLPIQSLLPPWPRSPCMTPTTRLVCGHRACGARCQRPACTQNS